MEETEGTGLMKGEDNVTESPREAAGGIPDTMPDTAEPRRGAWERWERMSR